VAGRTHHTLRVPQAPRRRKGPLSELVVSVGPKASGRSLFRAAPVRKRSCGVEGKTAPSRSRLGSPPTLYTHTLRDALGRSGYGIYAAGGERMAAG